jgi:2-polyprenyl-3-methyl-5-hydroxy-6-metoxy-1,4-benzoquinol methylase
MGGGGGTENNGFDAAGHWQRLWNGRDAAAVSWHQPRLEMSLAMIRSAGVRRDARIIDVGGGASTLVDSLLDLGFSAVTVLDIAQAAIDLARARLGTRAAAVTWIVGDVTAIELPGPYDVWHDRAVFHFLTEPEGRAAYGARLRAALRPGGQAILATFGPAGPDRCSGLPTMRYDGAGLLAALGPGFALVESSHEDHRTPAGQRQQFVYARLLRR